MDKISKILNYKSLIILCLYMAVVFVPDMKTYEIMTPQWLYLSILNLGVFAYFIYSKVEFKINLKDKLTTLFFLCHIGLLLISVISMVKSRSTDESLLYISWYATFFGALLNFYFLFNQTQKIKFNDVAKLISLVLLIESFSVVNYFLSHYSDPRCLELINGIKHFYANRNILATALVIKLPFAIYLFIRSKGFIKQLSLLATLLTTASVLYIGARTAILALFLVYIFAIISYIILFKKEEKKIFKIPVILIIGFFFSLLLCLSSNKIDRGMNSFNDLLEAVLKKNLYLDIPENKNKSVSSGRFLFWEEALNDIKDNPILGLGSGNWKFDNYDEVLLKAPNTSYMTLGQPHNDFLQHFVEEGVLGFIFYLNIYVLAFILLIKKLKNTKQKEIKFILLTLAFAIMAYVIDALLNFPHERPTIQLFFALFLALLFTMSIPKKEDDSILDGTANENQSASISYKLISISFISLAVFTLVINYCMFNSALIQYEIARDTNKINAFTDPYSMDYATFLKRMPDFPDAMILGESIEHSKALYAISSNKNKEALKHLNKAIKQFPNNYVSHGLKAQFYYVNKNLDSAYHYSKYVFEKSPSVTGNLTILANIYVKRKDTLQLFKILDKYTNINPFVSDVWRRKAASILKFRKNSEQAIKVLDSGLYYIPKNEVLLNTKKKIKASKKIITVERPKMSDEEFKEKETNLKAYYDKGNNFFTAKKYDEARTEYLKALDISPKNLPIVYKLGFLEKNVKNHIKSIEYFTTVINANFVNDGRPEYSRGAVYLRLGDQVNAKKDFTVSRQKGFPLALKLDASNFE